MRRLLFMRHAPTDWNAAGRIQGRADIALGAYGEALAASRSVPSGFQAAMAYASPLRRARQTASLMGIFPVRSEPSLVEMDWGAWEGRTLSGLRRELGETMAQNEARGLDFRPVAGESPRDVQTRVYAWLEGLRCDDRPVLAVTHKGVIRALLALATDWDMRDSPPVRLDWDCGHEFSLCDQGDLHLSRPNLPLKYP